MFNLQVEIKLRVYSVCGEETVVATLSLSLSLSLSLFQYQFW